MSKYVNRTITDSISTGCLIMYIQLYEPGQLVLYGKIIDSCSSSNFPPQDLSRLGRDVRKVVIIDNSPQSYIFHPDNAVSGEYSMH